MNILVSIGKILYNSFDELMIGIFGSTSINRSNKIHSLCIQCSGDCYPEDKIDKIILLMSD